MSVDAVWGHLWASFCHFRLAFLSPPTMGTPLAACLGHAGAPWTHDGRPCCFAHGRTAENDGQGPVSRYPQLDDLCLAVHRALETSADSTWVRNGIVVGQEATNSLRKGDEMAGDGRAVAILDAFLWSSPLAASIAQLLSGSLGAGLARGCLRWLTNGRTLVSRGLFHTINR